MSEALASNENTRKAQLFGGMHVRELKGSPLIVIVNITVHERTHWHPGAQPSIAGTLILPDVGSIPRRMRKIRGGFLASPHVLVWEYNKGS